MRVMDKALRRQSALAWWFAATLARRNDRLIVWEHHPLDGLYDCLGVRDATLDKIENYVDLNRPGSVHVHGHGAERWKPVLFSDLLLSNEPIEVVKKVEQAAGWKRGHRATSPNSLTYRVIARVLQSLVDEREQWDARQVFDETGYDPTGFLPPETLDEFPNGRRLLEAADGKATTFTPWEHVWVLQRDHEPIALLDTRGQVITADTSISMMPVYEQHRRRLEPVIAAALAHVLP